MRHRTSIQRLMRSLKDVLKARGISYRDVARAIGMSESGVKKVFSKHDISMGRLSQFTDFLGISITDLLVESQNREAKRIRFSEAQEAFFLAHPDCFHFFWKLVYERLSLAEIEQLFALSKKASFRYLRRLDAQGLLVLGPGEKLRLPPVSEVQWVGEGPFIRKLYREWSLRMMKELATPALSDDKLFMLRYFKFRPKTYREFLGALKDLEIEFVRRTAREVSLGGRDLIPVRWLTAADQNTFVPTLNETV